MNNKLRKDMGFAVYGFMVEDLGLSGNALLVYALIYSFRRSGLTYYGTQEYLANRIGCVPSTVKRTLKALVNAKLITKVYDKESKTPIYIINEDENDLNNFENGGSKKAVDFNTFQGAFCPSERLILPTKNKEIIKNTSSTSSSECAFAQKGNSSISFLRYGLEGLVTMTEEQYLALCNSIGDEMTETYINRLETYLIANPGVCLKSHYKTLCKWVREDAAL